MIPFIDVDLTPTETREALRELYQIQRLVMVGRDMDACAQAARSVEGEACSSDDAAGLIASADVIVCATTSPPVV